MNREQLQNWALLAEVLGGLAVLVTLIILIFQVREGTRAIRAQTAQELFALSTEVNVSIGDNPRVEEAYLRWLEGGYDSLSQEDAARVNGVLQRIMSYSNNAYYQYRQGTLDEDVYRAFQARLVLRLNDPGFADYWEQRRQTYTAAFQNHVDQLLRELATN